MTLRTCPSFFPALIFLAALYAAPAAPQPPPSPAQPTDTAAILQKMQADIQALKAKSEKGWKSPDVWIPAICTLLGASGGWISAAFIQKRTAAAQQAVSTHSANLAAQQADRAADRAAAQLKEQIEREEQRRQGDAARADRERLHDRLFDSLQWFSGDTQKRSIGIGIVEANWDAMPEIRQTWTAILLNQAVHLLTHSKERFSLVELDNLVRILRLLGFRGPKETPVQHILTYLQRQHLRQAIRRSENQGFPAADEPIEPRGLAILPETLQLWSAWLDQPSSPPAAT